MYVIFFTDDRITGRGFNATYLAVEGMHHVQVGVVLITCADPESFVRGGPTLTTFFSSFFLLSFFS